MADQHSSEELLAKGGGRTEVDADSRGFLQVAEEHRRQGEIAVAIELLRAGLEKHPNYISAQVALGRCYLEQGEVDKARRVLDKVVDQDVTHLVAAKLLVEIHLQRSDAALALRQLDLYSVLNNSDPDIEPLRKRIEALDRAAEAEDSTPQDAGQQELSEPTEATVDPEVITESLPAVDSGRRAQETESPRRLALAEAAELFPSLQGDGHHRLYLEKLGGEGIFPVASSWVEALEEREAAEELESELEVELETEAPGAASLDPASPETTESPTAVESDEPRATATLGELYLAQGHGQEAKRIFDDVLTSEPDNEAARLGLAKLATLDEATERMAEVPAQASVAAQPAAEPSLPSGTEAASSLLECKKSRLMRYLETLQAQPEHDVS